MATAAAPAYLARFPPGILPLPANRVWSSYLGGRELDRLRGRRGPRDDHYPEDRLGSVTTAVNPGLRSDEQAGQSWVESAGQRHGLPERFQAHPGHFFPNANLAASGPQPEMLVKLLNRPKRLQLQTHPTREFARQVPAGLFCCAVSPTPVVP